MRVAILTRSGPPYDEVKTSRRPWLKHLKRDIVDPETSIYYYLKYYYKDVVSVDKYSVYTIHKLNPKKYDHVFCLFSDFTLTYFYLQKIKRLDLYNGYVKKLKTIKNLIPNLKLMEFITDKCKYLDWLKQHGFPIIPTTCFKTQKLKTNQLIKLTNKKPQFLKSAFGLESKNTKYINSNTNRENVSGYISYVKSQKYKQLISQNFMNNFATKENPELRTMWVGTKYMYTIETESVGWPQKVRKKRLPSFVFKESQRAIVSIGKKFDTEMIVTRIDWGKGEKGYFINEIEYAGGTFAERFPQTPKGWKVDAEIAKYIVSL